MTIPFSVIIDSVKRHLSIIGKRLYDKDGKNLFSNITTSTAEDPIFSQYIENAAQNIESMLTPFIRSAPCIVGHGRRKRRSSVSTYAIARDMFWLDLENKRGFADFDVRCEEYVVGYMIMYTTGRYLAMTHPELSEKYYADANQRLESLIAYAFYKNPPTSFADPLSSTVTVTTNS